MTVSVREYNILVLVSSICDKRRINTSHYSTFRRVHNAEAEFYTRESRHRQSLECISENMKWILEALSSSFVFIPFHYIS
uniref:Uncharacterized protein n=1 Tax=Megaselia scalaris TaxID=36166 RepID=T1GJF8_MEGSC